MSAFIAPAILTVIVLLAMVIDNLHERQEREDFERKIREYRQEN